MGKITRYQSVTKILSVLFLFCLVTLKADLSRGAMLFVDQEETEEAYTTIGAAIDAADSYDIIVVREGTYYEHTLSFSGKVLTLKSESGAAATIIDCQGNGRALSFGAAESGSLLEGFTIQNGSMSWHAGGIYISSSNPIIRNCIFKDNQTTAGGTSGGAVWVNGGSPIFENCLFEGNQSNDRGGAIDAANGADVTITNCTFVNNSAGNSGGGFSNVATATINNSIFWGNTAPTGSQSQINNEGSLSLGYSDLQGGIGAISNNSITDLSGNINVYPAFISSTNFHLSGSSPCIDSGDYSALMDPPPLGEYTDLDESYRLDNGDIDMGAYEYRVADTYTLNEGALAGVTTLQGAIDHYLVGGGDTVEVPPGIYSGSGNVGLSFGGKDITLRSVPDSLEPTIIDCGGTGTAFSFYRGNWNTTVLDGFTIRNCQRGIEITYSGPTIKNSRLEKNIAQGAGGGIIIHGQSQYIPHIINTTFYRNISTTDGGAVAIFSNRRVWIEDSLFKENKSGDAGGAISISGATLEVRRTKFEHNSSVNKGGAIYTSAVNSLLVDNSIFYGNESDKGGAVFIDVVPDPNIAFNRFYFCTFTENSATTTGGALHLGTLVGTAGSFTIHNSIIWGNTSLLGASQLSGNVYQLNMRAVNIEGGFPSDEDGVGGEEDFFLNPDILQARSNIIDADPLFTFEDDLHLQSQSPCIDAGFHQNADELVDLEGKPRLVDGDGDSVALVDLGAYEYTQMASASFHPQYMSFYYHEESGPPDLQYLTIRNTSGSDLNWRLESNQIWLLVEPGQTDVLLAPGAEQQIKILPDSTEIDKLSPGKHWATLTLVNAADSSSLFTMDVELVMGQTLRVLAGGSIQATIDSVGDGDVVFVEAGTFNGPLDFNGKEIVLRSESGPEHTVINCSSASASCILYGSGEASGSVFDGFTVQDADNGAMLISNFASPTVVNSVFYNNMTDAYGGAISIWSNGVYIANCTFLENSAMKGGAIFITGGWNNKVVNSTFIENRANLLAGIDLENEGGGVYISYGGSNTIQECIFDQNEATVGGGVRIKVSDQDLIMASQFHRNIAYEGAAVFTDSNTIISNGRFHSNSSDHDGGAITSMGNGQISNSTFVKNVALGAGGGVYGETGTNIINSIFWENISDSPYHHYNGLPTDIAICGINVDPLFVNYTGNSSNAENDDLGLTPESTCIDAGADITWLHSDIRGSLRPIDGGKNSTYPDAALKMDIGAYEFSDYWGGSERDQIAKPFMDLSIDSSVALTNHEYQIEWKDMAPFPTGDKRVQQSGEYAVMLSLISRSGRRIDLLKKPKIMRTTPAGYSLPVTFDATHLGTWRIRLEMAADPNQYVESADLFISYQEVAQVKMGDRILPPQNVAADQQPDVDVEDAVYWSAQRNKLFAVKPTTVVVTWYTDETQTEPVPTILHIVPRTEQDDPPLQIHVAESQPVDLLPEGTRFDGVTLLYSGSGATQNANTFVAQNEGYSVLLYTDDNAESIDNSEFIRVVQTVKWDQIFEGQDWDIGKEVESVAYHNSDCGNGYVFYEDGWYNGYGPNSSYDRENREGPIFAVNRDLTGLMSDSQAEPQDDLIVVWYEKADTTKVCWPFKPVQYNPQWPTDAAKIVIASGIGSGSLLTTGFGLSEDMQIYNQPDENEIGYNPNEEHAALFTVPGSNYLGVFALRNDLNTYDINGGIGSTDWTGPLAGEDNQRETSAPYVLLKYKDPEQNNRWNFEAYKVIRQSKSYEREGGTIGPDFISSVPEDRYYIDSYGELQDEGKRYLIDSLGRIVSPYTNNLRFNYTTGSIHIEYNWAEVNKFYIDSDGVIIKDIFPVAEGEGFYLNNQGYLVDQAETEPAWFNFDNGSMVSVEQATAIRYYLDVDGHLQPADSYYLNADGYLAKQGASGERWYQFNGSIIEEVTESEAVRYYINNSGSRTESKPAPAFSLDKQGVLVEHDIYHRFHFDAEAGQEINPFYPVRDLVFGPCAETATTTPDSVLQDKDDKYFARNGGIYGERVEDVRLQYFYRLQSGFFFDEDGDGIHDADAPIGSCIPLLDDGSETPITTTFSVRWPDVVPTLYVGETLTEQKMQEGESVGLPNIADQCSVEVVFD